MSIFHKHDDQTFELQGNHMTGLATPSRGAEKIEVWRAKMDIGAATPPHSHDDEEIVVVLKGRGVAKVGDREQPFEEGDTLILPPRQVHQLVCTDSAIDGVVAMPLGSPVRTPDGQVMDLPWRK